ncbi:MAG: hypothetical protein ABSD31_17115, partial [Candidatus Binataceae bacterium]
VSMWLMVWWPYALVHRLNPLFTDLLWAPIGLNLAWTTIIPLPSLAVWPVTATLGPIAAYNVLSLTSLPLSAWSAFILCRRICRAWWPALLGGYIFGFSSYMLGHQIWGNLCLTMVFLVPLAVVLIVRAIGDELAPRTLTVALAAILVAQFLISNEIFATMTVVGAMALFLGWSFAPPEIGKRILRTLMPIAAAYALAVIVLAPYIHGMFAFGSPSEPIWSLDAYAADLLNFALPAPTNALGTIPLIGRLSAPFCIYSVAEVNAYVGLPLLIIALAYAWRHWREPLGKLLVDSLIITSVLAMGPLLHFRGAALCVFPGKILPLLPLLNKALPARFMMYSFLLLAIIAALWFAANRYGAKNKIALAAIVVFSTLPNLSAAYWTHRDDSPAFFTSALHRRYLAPGENVLVLPFGIRGNSMLWQAETEMYFRLVGGWTGLLPPEFRDWPIVDAFLNAAYLPDVGAQLSAFMAHHEVNTIAVVDGDPDAKSWHALASRCCEKQQSAGGVTVYHLAPGASTTYGSASAIEMRQRADAILFDTLMLAANRWLADGNSLDRLNPLVAQQHGLLPASWVAGAVDEAVGVMRENQVTDSQGRYYLGAWLGPATDGYTSVGVYGSYAALEPIIARYRQSAAHIYFPYPHDLPGSGAPPRPSDMHGLMVVEFERSRLAAAADQIRRAASTASAPSSLTTDGKGKKEP